ncbi:MAG: cell division protein FtsA [Chloroflexales bacterium]|nr:cell division protein FtsA [Chloroflexales bacterium]
MAVRPIVGIDIGTSKICTVIGQIDKEDRINVLGYGIVPSKGIERGMVVNIEEASRAVIASINKAEQSGYRVGSAYVSISGKHIRTYNRTGMAAISRAGEGVVTRDEIMRAIETAQADALPANLEILHVMPYRFRLDGNVVRDPIGMHGFRLEIDVHIVVCEMVAIQNLIKVLQEAGVEIDEVVLQPLAAAEAVLTSEERESGVVLIDMGCGTTSVAFFAQGNTWHTHVIPIGGHTFTSDIIMTFQINPHSAEHNKQILGDAIADPVRHQELVEIEGGRAGDYIEISRFLFNQCIQARADELIDFVIVEVNHSIYEGNYGSGIVLTGGGAQMTNIDTLFEDRFNAPVRVGLARDVYGLTDALNSPMYATVLGLIQIAVRMMRVVGLNNGNASKNGYVNFCPKRSVLHCG